MKEQILPTMPLEMGLRELNYWKGEIRTSQKRQKKEFIDEIDYEKQIKYLESKQVGSTNNQWCVMDEYSPAVISVVSAVYYQNPTIQVEAKNPDASKLVQPSLLYLLQHPEFKPFNQTDLLRGALIYSMEHSGLKDEMQIAAFDLLLAGYAVVEENHKVGNDEEPREDSTPNPVQNIVSKGVDAVKGMVDSFFDKKDSEEEVAEKVAKDTHNLYTDTTSKTYTKRWSPMDILFDSRALVFKESRWIAKRIIMTLAEFHAKYPQFKNKNVTGGESPEMNYSQHLDEKNRKMVVLYEIEIKTNGPRNHILVLNMALDEPVDYYERPIITNNFSLKYGCVDKYGKIYPMSRGRKAQRPQDDINHYMTVQFEHVDRAQRKIAYFEGGLTEAGKAAARSSDVYALVAKNTPQPVFEPMPAPQVVIENKEIVMAMRETINKSVGTSELAKVGDSNNDTLGQDELQAQAFMSNVNAVQDALQEIANQILDAKKDIVLQVWDGDDYFKVTGIQGGDAWYDPSMGPLADILIGDYSVRANIATAARPNPMKERRDMMELNALVTSPQMVEFAMLHGKKPSMETLNNLIKNFNMNPEMVYEPLQPVMPGIPGAMPGAPMPPQDSGQPLQTPQQQLPMEPIPGGRLVQA